MVSAACTSTGTVLSARLRAPASVDCNVLLLWRNFIRLYHVGKCCETARAAHLGEHLQGLLQRSTSKNLTLSTRLSYNCRTMQIASGKVINGQVIVEAELPEGAQVTLIALDGEETFEVTPELKAVLLESMAQGDRGETISGEQLLRELHSRE